MLRLLSAPNYQVGDESERQVTVTIRGEVPQSPTSSEVTLTRLSDLGDATFTTLAIQDPNVPDRMATRVAVNSFQNVFDVSMRWAVKEPIKVGDAMLVSFYARKVSPLSQRAWCHDHTAAACYGSLHRFAGDVDVSSEWQQYLFPFRHHGTLPLGPPRLICDLDTYNRRSKSPPSNCLTFRERSL